MSNYCTCHIGKEKCFWCKYQVVKKSLGVYKKQNKRYREALVYIASWKSSPHEKYINHLKKVARKALEGGE